MLTKSKELVRRGCYDREEDSFSCMLTETGIRRYIMMSQMKVTRKQALEEGKQRDMSEIAKEAGLVFPVFITDLVWNNWITPDQKSRDSGQNEEHRFKYVISKLVYSLRVHRQTSKSDTIYFNVSFTRGGELEDVMLISKLGVIDSDDPRPCITIMMPEEDLEKAEEG